jgi:FkbM family methyltransferase
MKIPNAVKKRLPGGDLYNVIVHYPGLKGHDSPPGLERAIYKALWICLFFGKKNKYYLRLQKILYDYFTDSAEESLLNINGMKIPKPHRKREEKVVILEALDILAADILGNEALCKINYVEGPYEYKDVRVSPADIVIDCGANMGVFSALAANRGGIVYAFEPSRYIIEQYLGKTAAHNPNISVCPFALSNLRQEVEFHFDIEHMSSGFIVSAGEGASAQTETVQTITLDEFVHENNIAKVDFIKADIEGAERYMLMGAKNVLKDFAPKLALCTYHLPDDPQVLRELILGANPHYVIEEKYMKMYAYVPG